MLIDTCANLTHDTFNEDFNEILARAEAAGVKQLIVTGASAQGSERAWQLAEKYPQLFATCGVHPHHATETSYTVMARFREIATKQKVVAIGETGLDFFRDFSPRPAQQASFEKHIELALDTGLPMFLHERDAAQRFAEVLAPHSDKLPRKVVHCFTGDRLALHTYLDLGCYIGITGWICDERRGQHLLELVKEIPADRLMIETDAPYLMPRTLDPKPKTRRNEPMYLTAICETVATCLGLDYDELARLTTENARRFFDLPPDSSGDSSGNPPPDPQQATPAR